MNFGFGNGGLRSPGNRHSAHTGEKLPIAKIPAGLDFKPGQDSIHAGQAGFSQLRYGPCLRACTGSLDFTAEAQRTQSHGIPKSLCGSLQNLCASAVQSDFRHPLLETV